MTSKTKLYLPGELKDVYHIIRTNPDLSLEELEKKYFCPSGINHKGKVVHIPAGNSLTNETGKR